MKDNAAHDPERLVKRVLRGIKRLFPFLSHSLDGKHETRNSQANIKAVMKL